MSAAVPLMLPASSSACAKVFEPLRPSRYSGDAAAAYRSASTLSGIFLLMVLAAFVRHPPAFQRPLPRPLAESSALPAGDPESPRSGAFS